MEKKALNPPGPGGMTPEEVQVLFDELEKECVRTVEEVKRYEEAMKEEKASRVRQIVEERRLAKMTGLRDQEIRALGEKILSFLEYSSGLSVPEIQSRLECPPGVLREALYNLEREGRIVRTGRGVRGDPWRFSNP